jgi:hypothetical protein
MKTTEGMIKKRIPKQFLGAFKAGHRHAAKEYVDEEFSLSLLKRAELGCEKSKEALEFITKFNNEYYKCVFTKTEEDFFGSLEDRSERYHERYARKMDILAAPQISIETVEVVSFGESALIELIDLKREMKKSKKQ